MEMEDAIVLMPKTPGQYGVVLTLEHLTLAIVHRQKTVQGGGKYQYIIYIIWEIAKRHTGRDEGAKG